jgi:hypothetical protein
VDDAHLVTVRERQRQRRRLACNRAADLEDEAAHER